MHFDEAEFPHTIGTGNKTINTADLSAPSFQGKDFFDATLYTGNSATQTVGGGSDSKFTAFAWIKDRDAASSNMLLIESEEKALISVLILQVHKYLAQIHLILFTKRWRVRRRFTGKP